MRFSSTLALAIAFVLVIPAGIANATALQRLAGVESLAGSPFDFDQVGTNCGASTAERSTTFAYAGSASLKVHTETDLKCQPYARGIFESNSPSHLESEDTLWFGAAIYLPKGFYSAHTSYTDLLRIDSYVNDEGESTPFEDRAEINFASWDNDDLYVRAAHGATNRDLIGPISPELLPEGTWNWVEIHLYLDTSEAITELYINGSEIGTSHQGNLFSGAAPFNRLRYGLVSTGTTGSGNLTAYFDRASISFLERGPTPSQNDSRVSVWPLNEPNGTLAADAKLVAPGTYTNGPTLGTPGVVAGSTAASFDGTNDYVAVTPTPPLDTKSGVTLEAWIKPDALQGSVIRRNNSYELRAQSDGSVLFRIWVGEELESLTSEKGVLKTGQIYQLAGAYDGASMRIFVDGEQIASQAQTGRISHSGNSLYVGRNDGSGTYFDGIIDDPTVYSEALSGSTILENFEYGDTHGEIIKQVPNQSATTDVSGWSSPAVGTLTRFTSDVHWVPFATPPASFQLFYFTGSKGAATTVAEVADSLNAEEKYTFRFHSRAGGGDLTSPSGGCIHLYLVNEESDSHCLPQDDSKVWKLHEVTFEPEIEVESYSVEFIDAPEGFLEAYIGRVLFDDPEVVPAD